MTNADLFDKLTTKLGIDERTDDHDRSAILQRVDELLHAEARANAAGDAGVRFEIRDHLDVIAHLPPSVPAEPIPEPPPTLRLDTPKGPLTIGLPAGVGKYIIDSGVDTVHITYLMPDSVAHRLLFGGPGEK